MINFYAFLYECETASQTFSFVAGLPYASMMLNLFFTLIDRYISITYSTWYKQNVTIGWIVSIPIAGFSTIVVVMKSPYLFELVPFTLRLSLFDVKFTSIFGVVIFILCIISQIFVYIKIKRYVAIKKRSEREATVETTLVTREAEHYFTGEENANSGSESMEEDITQDRSLGSHQPAQALQVSLVTRRTLSTYSTRHFFRHGTQTISRLELEAARHGVDSITLFCVLGFPIVVTLALAFFSGCISLPPGNPECSTYLWALAYARGILIVNAVVNPVFYIIRSYDMTRALIRMRKLISNIFFKRTSQSL